MTNKKINSLQLCILITFIIISTITGIGMTNIIHLSGRDSYISVIVAGIIGIIPLVLIMMVNGKDNNLTISEIITKIFGKYLGLFLNIVINIVVLIIGIVTMYSVSNFIVSQFLSDTSVLAISIVFGVLLWYGAVNGLEVLTRTGLILLVFTIILFLIAGFTLMPQVDINNIKPFLEYGIGKPIWAGVILFLTNIVPIYLLLMIPRSKVTDKNNYNKFLIIFYILGILMALSTTFITISILGINLAKIYQYPEYIVLKKISLFGFLDRIENIICIQWIFRCFMMLSLIIYYISNSVKKDNTSRLLPLGIIVLIILGSKWYFKNNTIFSEFILNIYPYLNLILFIIIFIVCIIQIIKNKTKKSTS